MFRPAHANELPRNPKSDKFHNYYRHDTNECRNLKGAIEKLIQEGHLLEYVRQEFENLKKKKEDKNEDKDPKKGLQIQEPQHSMGTIIMIYGGPTSGDSNKSRKVSVRRAQNAERYEIFKVSEGLLPPDITLGQKMKEP